MLKLSDYSDCRASEQISAKVLGTKGAWPMALLELWKILEKSANTDSEGFSTLTSQTGKNLPFFGTQAIILANPDPLRDPHDRSWVQQPIFWTVTMIQRKKTIKT